MVDPVPAAHADQGRGPDYLKLTRIQAKLMRGTYAIDVDAIATAMATALIKSLAPRGPA